MFYVIPDNSNISIENLGGKGYNLYLLRNITTIPNTLILSTQIFEEFIEKNRLKKIIDSLLDDLDINNYKKIEKTSKEIKKLFLEATVFPLNITHIKEKIKRWGKVSVRSSSNYEDLSTASFAGQHESYLNVSMEGLEIAIRNVWASLYTPRAITYRIIKNITHSKVKMAVVIQEMIYSKKAGVIFTKNPVTGNLNEILIEAVFGFGEGIVSGKVTPDNYLIDKKTGNILEENISEKNISIECSEGSGIIEKKIKSNKKVLNNEEINKLWKESVKIEKYFGKPQDIEWAIDNNNDIWILQSRDITV